MNKELEEAIKRLAEINEKVEEYDGNILKQDIETVLNYIENSIPKQLVEEKIEELERQRRELGFKTYLRREDMLNDDRAIVYKLEVLKELPEGK